MRTNLQILAFLLTILSSSASLAQESVKLRFNTADTKSYHNLDSAILKQNFKITSILPAEADTTFPFQSHLPTRLLNKHEEIVLKQAAGNFRYHYNMPIAKPKTNSKILIAKLDPKFPYNYTTPIKKLGAAEN